MKGFWVHKNKVCTIKKVLEPVNGEVGMVEIEYIQRDVMQQFDTTPISGLTELTRYTAQELLKKYNRRIAKSNVQIHAINECLRYM